MFKTSQRYGSARYRSQRTRYGQQRQGGQLLSLILAAVLALWLLFQPAAIGELPMTWRLPIWLLGLWALGAGFFHGMGLVRGERMQRWLGAPLCWILLGLLLIFLILRQ
jgi:predicted membrane protein